MAPGHGGAAAPGEHPVVACYHGFDSAAEVQLGALLASGIDERLVLTTCHAADDGRGARDAASASGRLQRVRALARHSNAARRRTDAAQGVLRRARTLTSGEVELHEQVVEPAGTARALAAFAREVDACLLTLGGGTHARAVRELLAGAPCPVAIAPLTLPLPAIARPEAIGVVYDSSLSARWTLVVAERLVRATGARMVVLAAAPTKAEAAAWLSAAARALDTDCDYEPLALVGDPASALVPATATLDLVVCGAKGRARPFEPPLRSAAGQLVEHAQCPVVVVPPGVWRSDAGPLGITSAASIP